VGLGKKEDRKMKTEIRTFIAIELSPEIKSFLANISQELRIPGADVKWVRTEGIHLTLKFLGNVHVELVPQIEEKARAAFDSQSPICLEIRGLGAFPDTRRPRVIWAGCLDPDGRLAPMVLNLENLLEPLGFSKEERPFNPHLTLGRVRSNSGIAELMLTMRKKMDIVGPGQVADHAVLFESVLKPTGAEYSRISRFDFHG
jgi:RNA 2',3'-cyclic 3'-phosphodiesterase